MPNTVYTKQKFVYHIKFYDNFDDTKKTILLLFIENFNLINNYCYIGNVNEAHVTKISVFTKVSQKLDTRIEYDCTMNKDIT